MIYNVLNASFWPFSDAAPCTWIPGSSSFLVVTESQLPKAGPLDQSQLWGPSPGHLLDLSPDLERMGGGAAGPAMRGRKNPVRVWEEQKKHMKKKSGKKNTSDAWRSAHLAAKDVQLLVIRFMMVKDPLNNQIGSGFLERVCSNSAGLKWS